MIRQVVFHRWTKPRCSVAVFQINPPSGGSLEPVYLTVAKQSPASTPRWIRVSLAASNGDPIQFIADHFELRSLTSTLPLSIGSGQRHQRIDMFETMSPSPEPVQHQVYITLSKTDASHDSTANGTLNDREFVSHDTSSVHHTVHVSHRYPAADIIVRLRDEIRQHEIAVVALQRDVEERERHVATYTDTLKRHVSQENETYAHRERVVYTERGRVLALLRPYLKTPSLV